MQVSAKLRYARISPQKCRLVADEVRGKSVANALQILGFMPKKGAAIVKKVLESAVANAEHNHGADVDELKVSLDPRRRGADLSSLPCPGQRPRCNASSSVTVISPSRSRTSRNGAMGQKVNPIGIRLGITRDWTSRWYADSKTYPDLVASDFKVRGFLKQKLKDASVSRIQIERPARKAQITIHTARPGIVIGKKGEDIERLRVQAARLLELPVQDVRLNIAEVRKPELDAQLVAEGIAQQLERRVMFRRAMKRAVTNTMRLGAQGIKVKVGGRLNGAEIARSEWYREGRVPPAHLPRGHRLRLRGGAHHLRRHRRESLDLQG